MGRKQKMKQFAESDTFPNLFFVRYFDLFDESKGFPLRSNWNRDYFKNDNPIVLELGCGKGDYTVGLAERYPDKNYIGIDLKSNRMWKGAKEALEKGMSNVAFIRGQVQHIERYFAPEEVSEIWITFPDPQLESPRIRKRFTHPSYIDRYRKVLTSDNLFHLKTDSEVFYTYTLEQIEEQNYQLVYKNGDLYNSEVSEVIGSEVSEIKTFYELKWLQIGRTIHYVRWKI